MIFTLYPIVIQAIQVLIFSDVYNDTTGNGNATFTGGSSFLTSDIEVYKLI